MCIGAKAATVSIQLTYDCYPLTSSKHEHKQGIIRDIIFNFSLICRNMVNIPRLSTVPVVLLLAFNIKVMHCNTLKAVLHLTGEKLHAE